MNNNDRNSKWTKKFCPFGSFWSNLKTQLTPRSRLQEVTAKPRQPRLGGQSTKRSRGRQSAPSSSEGNQRRLTSAATVHGFKARDLVRGEFSLRPRTELLPLVFAPPGLLQHSETRAFGLRDGERLQLAGSAKGRKDLPHRLPTERAVGQFRRVQTAAEREPDLAERGASFTMFILVKWHNFVGQPQPRADGALARCCPAPTRGADTPLDKEGTGEVNRGTGLCASHIFRTSPAKSVGAPTFLSATV